MGQLLLGAFASQMKVGTALQSKINCVVCRRFRPQKAHLLRCWQMDQLLHGVSRLQAVTALQSRINSEMYSKFGPLDAPLPRSAGTDRW
mmetsp:Transcript_77192/g.184811  ORF Transcript_77192/g.184811 Transcript_77192/m.184811 type:complete len:89 (+) Transcript_77192:1061-1327(+)